MYKNKCTKCGAEFETKNPKRVICPGCLYPDRKDISLQSYSEELKEKPPEAQQNTNEKDDSGFKPKPGFYVAKESQDQGYKRPDYSGQQGGGDYNRPRSPQQGGYRQDSGQGGYRPPQQGGFRQDSRPGGFRQDSGQSGYRQDSRPGGYRPPQQGGFRQDSRPGGYRQDSGQGGFRRPPQQGGFRQDSRPGGFRQDSGQGGFRRPPQQGGFRQDSRPGGRSFNNDQRRPLASNKKLLISKEQVFEIENLYREMLPLPNPDCHEVIGEKIGLEPNKVFFGINLVRQKFKLPKLPYPKRKLAVTIDQLTAIKNLYSPLLPLPPIGCHKFLAKQLKMDEWRVHVAIGIIRKQMDLPRWNTERDDAPAEFKNQLVEPPKKAEKAPKKVKSKKAEEVKEEVKTEE
ncbi:MAG TPA: hypothetical protein P5556_08665 [Candidatus Gastranaerophilales bacterium]|nr:hypothetical protein [Candidatus Gastranaerophilales bacterium]